MILQLLWDKNKGYQFQLLEDLDFHPLEQATREEIKEYREYLKEQLKMVYDILS